MRVVRCEEGRRWMSYSGRGRRCPGGVVGEVARITVSKLHSDGIAAGWGSGMRTLGLGSDEGGRFGSGLGFAHGPL